MHKEELISGFILAVVLGILLAYSPDSLSGGIVIIMAIIVAISFFFGIVKMMRYNYAFIIAMKSIDRIKNTNSDDVWLSIEQQEDFFWNNELDKKFKEYRVKVSKLRDSKYEIVPDIDTVVDEDYIYIKTWKNVITNVPNMLTGLGILGTFLGLLLGITGINLTSQEVIITSIGTLLNGIRLAFYTSISGVIVSMLFNIIYSYFWNVTMRNMEAFYEKYHRYIIPSQEEILKNNKENFYREVRERLEKIENKIQ